MVEQRTMDTGSPCSSTHSFNPESRIRGGPEPARKREPLRRKQAHHKLNPASHQISGCEGKPLSRHRLECTLSRRELHHHYELNPVLHSEHLALIPEHLHNRDHHQSSCQPLEQPLHLLLF